MLDLVQIIKTNILGIAIAGITGGVVAYVADKIIKKLVNLKR